MDNGGIEISAFKRGNQIMQDRRMRIVLLLLIIISLILAFSACEPLITISVQNKTDMQLKIYYGLEGDFLLGNTSPGGEVQHRTESRYSYYRISAKDENGNLVFSTTFTNWDLQGKKEYFVIITKDKIIPPSETGVSILWLMSVDMTKQKTRNNFFAIQSDNKGEIFLKKILDWQAILPTEGRARDNDKER